MKQIWIRITYNFDIVSSRFREAFSDKYVYSKGFKWIDQKFYSSYSISDETKITQIQEEEKRFVETPANNFREFHFKLRRILGSPCWSINAVALLKFAYFSVFLPFSFDDQLVAVFDEILV